MESYQRAAQLDPGNPIAKQGLGRVQGGVGSLFN
jgi:cytochrome c-type biogenesis protein CcmH/NrfG